MIYNRHQLLIPPSERTKTMTIEKSIESKVNDSLHPELLVIENESHNHGGPATESHFKLTIVAQQFASLSAVKRHQALYAILAAELAGPVHALALHLYAPAEWAQRQSKSPDSPNCLGGSKP
jgi:BolA family transcriptional regulator, general stress-responsive regulator